MRWIVLLLLLGLVGAVAKNGCHVREFYGIAYTVHDPTQRHREMVAWLDQNAGRCKSTEYMVIWPTIAALMLQSLSGREPSRPAVGF